MAWNKPQNLQPQELEELIVPRGGLVLWTFTFRKNQSTTPVRKPLNLESQGKHVTPRPPRPINEISLTKLMKSAYFTNFFLCSTTKYNMGHPPSDQALRCSVMLFVDTSMNRLASGITGFEPLVRVFRMSDGSPVPILQHTFLLNTLYYNTYY